MNDNDPENLTDYRIKQLFAGLDRLETAMRDGFADLKRVLDERLQSRDDRLDDIEERLRNTESRLDRKEGRDAVIGWISAAIGSAMIAGLVGLWFLAFKNGLMP